jgi:leucyl aminopeptidase
MKITAAATDPSKTACDVLLIPCFEGAKLPEYAKDLGGRLLKDQFSGKCCQTVLLSSGSGIKAKGVLLVGVGKPKELTLKGLREAICTAVRTPELGKLALKSLAMDANALIDGVGGATKAKGHGASNGPELPKTRWIGQALAEGAELGVYVYDDLLSNNEDKKKGLARAESLTVLAGKDAQTELKKGLSDGQAIANAVNHARDLCNHPNSHLKPAQLAKFAQTESAKIPGLKCTIMTKAQIKALKMGAFLSVNAGSDDGDGAARMIVMEYNGGKKGQKPIALVGKGLTFDTGGYSLKPAASMLGMKWDMGGAATMIAAALAIAAIKTPINMVCICPCTDNLVNEFATRPGDVVTAMNGTTIEVNNTDAEGRLILCDALTYVQKKYKPEIIIDAATLTGAVLVALGDQFYGVMANDDDFANEIVAASRDAGELAWQLPLPKEYESYLDSDIADISNIGGGGKAGTITAGLFLKRFIDEGQKWAHLDIAGVANNEGKQKGVAPAKGGTGTAVRTLVTLARNRAGA